MERLCLSWIQRDALDHESHISQWYDTPHALLEALGQRLEGAWEHIVILRQEFPDEAPRRALASGRLYGLTIPQGWDTGA